MKWRLQRYLELRLQPLEPLGRSFKNNYESTTAGGEYLHTTIVEFGSQHSFFEIATFFRNDRIVFNEYNCMSFKKEF